MLSTKINGCGIDMKNNKSKTVALVILIVTVIGLSIAFAVLSSNLTISENAYLDPVKWKIYFDDLKSNSPEGKAVIEKYPVINTNDKTKIEDMEVTLNIPGDKASFTVNLKNDGDIDAQIAKITKPQIDVKYIIFNAVYTDTQVEVKEGDTLGSGETKNITFYVYYDKENISNDDLPSKNMTIKLNTYALNFTQLDSNTSHTTASEEIVESIFSPITGKLGDNVYFNYVTTKNSSGEEVAKLSLTGSGDMYSYTVSTDEDKNLTGRNCDLQAGTEFCSLGQEIAIKVADKVGLADSYARKMLEQSLSYFILGIDYSVMGMTQEEYENYVKESVNEENANKIIEVVRKIPKFSGITISDEITSVRLNLFTYMKTNSVVLPDSIIKTVGEPEEIDCVFCYSYIGSITVGSGLKTLPKHLIYNGDVNNLTLKDEITTIPGYIVSGGNESLTTLTVPKTVTKIENNAFSNWKALTTIVNKTGNAFDWDAAFNYSESNYTPVSPFVTGKVNFVKSGQTVTITE